MIGTILLGVVLLALWLYFGSDHDPLDDLPGPKRLPIFGHAFLFIRMKPKMLFVTVREYIKNYGDRFVIKILRRRILHIHSPDDVEVVLSNTKNITKSYPYTILQPWLGTGLLLSTGRKWFMRRKILTPAFHFKILRNFSAIIEEKSKELVERLKEKNGVDVNLIPLISDFTLFTICETAMGTKLDADKSSATVEYKKAIEEIGTLSVHRLTRVWLHNNFIFSLSETGKHFQDALKKVHSFADNVIFQRKKDRSNEETTSFESIIAAEDEFGGKKRLAMMDLLLDAETKGEIDLEGIREEVNTFMFEGHDTTANAITFGLMLLADNQDVQDKIYKETQRVYSGNGGTVDMSALSDLKYLEAAIKEMLRLYPSVPFIARQVTEDFMLGDLKVKAGTEVAVHIYDLHRRPDLYPDPEEFKPERFLDGETRHPYAYVPFSAGPRNCIGQRFAMLEMKYVFSKLLRTFQVLPAKDGGRPAIASDLILRPLMPVYVKFVER